MHYNILINFELISSQVNLEESEGRRCISWEITGNPSILYQTTFIMENLPLQDIQAVCIISRVKVGLKGTKHSNQMNRSDPCDIFISGTRH